MSFTEKKRLSDGLSPATSSVTPANKEVNETNVEPTHV